MTQSPQDVSAESTAQRQNVVVESFHEVGPPWARERAPRERLEKRACRGTQDQREGEGGRRGEGEGESKEVSSIVI